MLAGIFAGAIAAVVASLLSLPLQSPDDVFFNSASVTIGALLAGLFAGSVRTLFPMRWFALIWTTTFIAFGFALNAGDAVLVRLLSFGLPIAAVVFGLTGVGVALLFDREFRRMPVMSGASCCIAVAIGFGLADAGDASGALALPASAAGSPGLPAARFATRADVQNVTFEVGEGSVATFTTAEQTIQLPMPNRAVVRDTALSGGLHLDARPSTITLDLMGLTSDQPRRDELIRSLFGATPKVTFTVTTLPDVPAGYESGQRVQRRVEGTLAINGVERAVAFDVEALFEGAVLNVLGKTSFEWADFDLTPPKSAIAEVRGPVAVEILLVARPSRKR